MSYTEEIVGSLIETLSKTAGLPVFQLAGHVPNLTFWMKEVAHAVGVVEGYSERFVKLTAAQAAFDGANPALVVKREFLDCESHPLRATLSSAQVEQLSKRLRDAGSRLIDRCLKEGLIDITVADGLRYEMGGVGDGRD